MKKTNMKQLTEHVVIATLMKENDHVENERIPRQQVFKSEIFEHNRSKSK